MALFKSSTLIQLYPTPETQSSWKLMFGPRLDIKLVHNSKVTSWNKTLDFCNILDATLARESLGNVVVPFLLTNRVNAQ